MVCGTAYFLLEEGCAYFSLLFWICFMILSRELIILSMFLSSVKFICITSFVDLEGYTILYDA